VDTVTPAAMRGVQRPLLNKVLKDLEHDGLIRTGYAAIEVLDRPRLGARAPDPPPALRRL